MVFSMKQECCLLMDQSRSPRRHDFIPTTSFFSSSAYAAKIRQIDASYTTKCSTSANMISHSRPEHSRIAIIHMADERDRQASIMPETAPLAME